MKTEKDFNERELQKYKKLYMEGCETVESLSSKLKKANEHLEAANIDLVLEKEKSRSLQSTVNRRPVLQCSCLRNFNRTFAPHRISPPRERLSVRTLNPQPSDDSMENYIAKMRQELDNNLTRAAREAAVADLKTFQVPPRRFANKSSDDLILEASQEYKEMLRRRYMT
ncbi:PREDICTED: ankyrin repeat domain-containing protein 26-like [Chinchilla lanigera]|uniref:ankyrin repeat domain-containing protein 26-like n=1 Tax=Chinchilla lanigera TaxID=34839 RepID=UPI000697F530|nr:PREDICTED: ankyrin repeat domain-containing protein 26-like [Chinchilla lanigera]